VTVIISS